MKVTWAREERAHFLASRSARVADLLHEPGVPVGIVQREERVVVGALRVGAVRLRAVLEVEELAHGRAAADELGACGFDVLDDEMQPLDRAALAVLQPLAECDRARRAPL